LSKLVTGPRYSLVYLKYFTEQHFLCLLLRFLSPLENILSFRLLSHKR